jgi:hypothetical protein
MKSELISTGVCILLLIRLFGPKMEKVTAALRKLHNKELHNLYSSLNMRRMTM